MSDRIKLIDHLIEVTDELKYADFDALDKLQRRARMILTKTLGAQSSYIEDLTAIWFRPSFAPSSEEDKQNAWHRGHTAFRNVLETAKEELQLTAVLSKRNEEPKNRDAQEAGQELQRSVFVVHGHDEELKQAAARTLEQLQFEPIILHEKPSKGRTIIEKFTDYSGVDFAVVLLSPDDIARPKDSVEESYRARQNVILELGFFLGKLGRDRVTAIYRPHESFELPSDYDGVIFVEYDQKSMWRFELARELKAAGFEVNLNAIC